MTLSAPRQPSADGATGTSRRPARGHEVEGCSSPGARCRPAPPQDVPHGGDNLNCCCDVTEDMTAGRTDGGARAPDLDAMLCASIDFEDFFHASWRRLYPAARAIAGDRASAEDALQTAFAKAYASWARVSAADHPEAYVRRMVVNEILNSRRSAWFRRERPTAEHDATASIASAEADVVDRDALWCAVQSLPVRQRAVIVLRYYEDLSEAEIADVLGCSRGTVKSQASAALKNLRTGSGPLLDPERSRR